MLGGGDLYEGVLGERIPNFPSGCHSEISEMMVFVLSTHRREDLVPASHPQHLHQVCLSPAGSLSRPQSEKRRMRVALPQLGDSIPLSRQTGNSGSFPQEAHRRHGSWPAVRRNSDQAGSGLSEHVPVRCRAPSGVEVT